MQMGTATEVRVSERQRSILEKWVRNRADSPYRLVLRCEIVLLSAAGVDTAEQGRRLNVDRRRPRRWRRRWLEAEDHLASAKSKDVTHVLCEAAHDDHRCGVRGARGVRPPS